MSGKSAFPIFFGIYVFKDGFYFFSLFQVGLSRDPANPTHPLPPTEPNPPPTDPTSPAVSDGFVSPKPEFDGSEVGFPSPESDQTVFQEGSNCFEKSKYIS